MNFIQPIRAKISVDLQRPSKNIIHVVEDDSARGASIALYSGGEPFEPGAATYAVTYKKPDGTRGFYDNIDGDDAVTASGNVLTVRFVDQMLTVPGEVQINIRMESSTAGVARTFAIAAIVHETAVPEGSESTDFFDAVGVQMREIVDSDGYFDDDTVEGALAELGAYMAGGGGGGGTTDHRQLTNRDASDQHPVAAITGLRDALNNKISTPTSAAHDGRFPQYVHGSGIQWIPLLGYRVGITDSGGYYTGTTVEAALQEIGAELAGVNTLLGDGM